MPAHNTVLPLPFNRLPGTGRPEAVSSMTEGEIALPLLGLGKHELSHPDHTALKRLYCANGGHHLRLQPDGAVDGCRQEEDIHTVFKVRACNPGVVLIQGIETGLYLAMDHNGRLFASATLSGDCYFLETMEENHYNTYRSQKHGMGQWYLALKRDGRPKLGPKTSISQKGVFFLPRRVGGS